MLTESFPTSEILSRSSKKETPTKRNGIAYTDILSSSDNRSSSKMSSNSKLSCLSNSGIDKTIEMIN